MHDVILGEISNISPLPPHSGSLDKCEGFTHENLEIQAVLGVRKNWIQTPHVVSPLCGSLSSFLYLCRSKSQFSICKRILLLGGRNPHINSLTSGIAVILAWSRNGWGFPAVLPHRRLSGLGRAKLANVYVSNQASGDPDLG